LDRGLLYEHFGKQCQRLKQGGVVNWQVNHMAQPCAGGVVALQAELVRGEVEIRMTELAPAFPEVPDQSTWEEHGLVAVATAIRERRTPLYLPNGCVVVPVRESDLIADRIHRYEEIRGHQLTATNRLVSPRTLLYRKQIVGVVIPLKMKRMKKKQK